MSSGPSIDEVQGRLRSANTPEADIEAIVHRHEAYEGIHPDLAFFHLLSMDRGLASVDGLTRMVTKQPYAIHLGRVAAAGIRNDPIPRNIEDWITACVIDAGRWMHDSGEGWIDRQVIGDAAPTNEQRISWGKRGILLTMHDFLERARTYQESSTVDSPYLMDMVRDHGYVVAKVTRDRGPGQIFAETDQFSYWPYVDELFADRVFPSSTEFPRLKEMFNGHKSQLKHALMGGSVKTPDRADIISIDLYPNLSDIEDDYRRALAEHIREHGDITDEQKDVIYAKYETYRDAVKQTDFRYMLEQHEQLRELHDTDESAFLKRLKELSREHTQVKRDLEKWGSHLMNGVRRVVNAGKSHRLMDAAYQKLSQTKNLDSYEAMSLKNHTDRLAFTLDYMLSFEDMHHRVFHAAPPKKRRSSSRIRDDINWSWADQRISTIKQYQDEYPEFAFRYTPDVPEGEVKPKFRRVHRFSTDLQALMGGDTDALRLLKRDRNQYLMLAIMREYMPLYLENKGKTGSFFHLVG